MNQEYDITSLREVQKQLTEKNNQFTTIGLIIDCANPNRKDVKKDYCMRLKIVDVTSINDACSVFLYAKNTDNFPSTIKVGDILFINRFTFEIWNKSLQAKKPFKVMSAFFRFFSGNPQVDNYQPIDNQIGLDDSEGKILKQLQQLRKVSKNYFKTHQIPLYSKGNKQSSDFDLVLKVIESKEMPNCYKIKMTNGQNDFYLNYNFKVNTGVYKVRSIANLSWREKSCYLVGNDYTCFLQISSWMKSYDPKQWDKIAVGKDTAPRTSRDKISTKILHEKRGDKRKLYNLKDLINKDQHHQEIAVKCQFVQFFTKFDQALKKYDEKNHLEKEYQSEIGKYIFNVHMAITDESMEGQIFNCYLYTYDGKGLQFMPDLDPKNIYGKNTLILREKYQIMVNRLLQETDIKECPVEMILSPMFNGRETIYRIVDTELLI